MLLGLVLLLVVTPAHAHTTTTGLATLSVNGAALTWRLTLVPSELPVETARLLTAAGDGEREAVQRADHELRSRLGVRADGAPCRAGRARLQGSGLGDGRITFELELRCPAPPSRLVVRDDTFDVLGAHHRTLVRVDAGGRSQDAALLSDAREASFVLAGTPPVFSGSFVRLGVEHILTGWDHLLFLVVLLLRGGGWLSLAKIITAFTLAHSVTLALAVLDVVTLPDRLVEAVIALSIAAVAAENLFLSPVVARRWIVSFAFGLVHGFGFSSALRELGLPTQGLVLALLGFNAGVELGQALVVALALPALGLLRRSRWEPRIVWSSSLAILLVGIVLFVERAFF